MPAPHRGPSGTSAAISGVPMNKMRISCFLSLCGQQHGLPRYPHRNTRWTAMMVMPSRWSVLVAGCSGPAVTSGLHARRPIAMPVLCLAPSPQRGRVDGRPLCPGKERQPSLGGLTVLDACAGCSGFTKLDELTHSRRDLLRGIGSVHTPRTGGAESPPAGAARPTPSASIHGLRACRPAVSPRRSSKLVHRAADLVQDRVAFLYECSRIAISLVSS